MADVNRGLGTEDDPAFAGMHEASARIAQGTLEICRGVWEGEFEHGVNYCGGLHHAMRGYASGFCIYNDIAVGIQWLLDHGAQRVAYVDIDVHHGDGVERMFWNDPRVLTISVHESGRHLFPGTGWPADIGGPSARGTVANVALPPGTGDSAWLRSIDSVVPPLVRAFAPDVLVTQHGCDTHMHDPLAHLAITVDAQRRAHESLHELAHEVAGGRWVALGGGGYELVEVVPRSWTHLTAIAAHVPLSGRHGGPAGVARPRAAGARAAWRRAGWATCRRPRCRSGCSPGTWGTTPRTRSTGPSSRPARRPSRTTAWTPGSTERHRPRGGHPRDC